MGLPKYYFFAMVALVCVSYTHGQTGRLLSSSSEVTEITPPAVESMAPSTTVPTVVTEPAPNKGLSRGFDDLVLGMSFDALSTALQRHAGFDYRGLPEVSLSPDGHEKIIETKGGRFISRAVFQFRDDSLFSIILDFNESQLDWYTLYVDFVARFGDPRDLSPRQALWEDGVVRILLEKPLTIKYLSVPVIEALQAQSRINRSLQEETRDGFIKKL